MFEFIAFSPFPLLHDKEAQSAGWVDFSFDNHLNYV